MSAPFPQRWPLYSNLPRASALLSLVALCLVADAQAPEPQITGRVVRADNVCRSRVQRSNCYLPSPLETGNCRP
jgi:hypothetical protein